jgi:aryl-alcohol dehydrogenase-like predicted oxidoreductase
VSTLIRFSKEGDDTFHDTYGIDVPGAGENRVVHAGPNLVLGCGSMSADDPRAAFAVLDAYHDAGGRMLDTARVYGTSEQVVGTWLRARAAYGDLTVVTKGAHPSAACSPRLSAPDVIADVESSLAALQVSSVHCYLLHRDDPATPVAEIARTLNSIVRLGHAETVGVSNWTPTRAAELAGELRSIDGPPLAIVSNYGGQAVPTAPGEWPGVRSSSPELLRLAHYEDFRVLGWSSLSGGYFTDHRPHPGFAGAENVRRRLALWQVAEEAGVAPIAVLVRTVATLDTAFVPVVSTRSPDRIRSLCAAAADRSLDEAVARFSDALRAGAAAAPRW